MHSLAIEAATPSRNAAVVVIVAVVVVVVIVVVVVVVVPGQGRAAAAAQIPKPRSGATPKDVTLGVEHLRDSGEYWF